jgi:DNA-binding response OmpR family regulator
VNGAKHDYAEALEGAGFRVTTVENMREALASRRRPDAVIVELVIPEGDLAQLAQATKSGRRTRALTVIALAAEDQEDTVVKAGATFCRHPCPPDELVGLVRKTLTGRRAGARPRSGRQRSSRRV